MKTKRFRDYVELRLGKEEVSKMDREVDEELRRESEMRERHEIYCVYCLSCGVTHPKGCERVFCPECLKAMKDPEVRVTSKPDNLGSEGGFNLQIDSKTKGAIPGDFGKCLICYKEVTYSRWHEIFCDGVQCDDCRNKQIDQFESRRKLRYKLIKSFSKMLSEDLEFWRELDSLSSEIGVAFKYLGLQIDIKIGGDDERFEEKD